jgi:signal transduction histidine kinase
MFGTRAARGWVYPVTVWLVLLAVVFAAEYAVMLLLPWLVPEHPSRLLESAVDAVVLTLLLAPVLWWTLVRPLREVIRLRTQFLADLFAQVESDRRRTAYELHDGVGQALTLLISGLRSARSCRVVEECAGRVDGFQRLAENALTEVRRLAMGLRPSLLDDLGLAPALERLVEDVRAHHPVAVSLDVAGVIGLRLPEQVATAVFRIVQEALTNVIKHSRARRAAVAVRPADGNVLVEVSDDGCGIDPARLRAPTDGHLGLTGMRERAALLGGEFSLDSAPGRGTRVAVTIPAGGTRGG